MAAAELRSRFRESRSRAWQGLAVGGMAERRAEGPAVFDPLPLQGTADHFGD